MLATPFDDRAWVFEDRRRARILRPRGQGGLLRSDAAADLRPLCLGFDLLIFNGQDLRLRALEERKARLGKLLANGDDPTLRLSHTFDDGERLLVAAARQGLEGIVSKRRAARYVAGSASGWIKVKTAEWREANRERYKLFEKAR